MISLRSALPQFLLALPLFCFACGKKEVAVARLITGFQTPESVLHDPETDVYLVSNIVGDPFEHDGDGYIARVTPDGKFLEERWIDGTKPGVELDAPKGMALVGDLLWVADIDHLRAFDRKTGAVMRKVAIPGATFLNDVCGDQDGTIYVSDSGFTAGFTPSGTDAIWRVKIINGSREEVATLARGDALAHPNGLGVSPRGDLFCVDWENGQMVLITPSGKIDAPLKLPAAQLDGLVRLDNGHWLVSSWEGQCVYSVAPNGDVIKLVPKLEQPADIGMDRKRNCLLIPLFGLNAVRVVPL